MKTLTVEAAERGRSPLGSHIRFLLDGPHGNLIHATVPPGMIGRACTFRTIEEYWYVLSGDGEILASAAAWPGERHETHPRRVHRHPLGHGLPVPLQRYCAPRVHRHGNAAVARRRRGRHHRWALGAACGSGPGGPTLGADPGLTCHSRRPSRRSLLPWQASSASHAARYPLEVERRGLQPMMATAHGHRLISGPLGDEHRPRGELAPGERWLVGRVIQGERYGIGGAPGAGRPRAGQMSSGAVGRGRVGLPLTHRRCRRGRN